MSRHYEVVIIGGGPVGIGLALELGLRDISCLIVEKRVGLSNIPKGQNLTQRTMEHFHSWGIVDEVRAARVMPPGSPIGEFVSYRHLDSPYWYTGEGRSVVNAYYHQRNERIPQYQTEKVMRERLSSVAAVEARFGWVGRQFEQDEGGVRVSISRENGSDAEWVTADYLVGCDGGHSMVREQAAIDRCGSDFDQVMVLAVFRSRQLHEELARRYPERSTYRVMHPDLRGYWQFFGRVDVGETWFFHAPVPPDTTKDNFDFHGMLEKVAGFPFACAFEHVGFWDLRVAVAQRYRAGRIFIAGDAAHNHPPYGGFGLNNGLEDIRNLGWKLAASLRGWGGASLLDSYDTERRPVMVDVSEDFIAERIRADGAFLARFSPSTDKVAFEAAWDARKSEYSDRTHAYEPHYEGSPIVFGPPGGKCSAHGSHKFEARAGHHLPPQVLGSGKNVYDMLGSRFTLLAFAEGRRAVDAFEQAAASLRMPLLTVDDPGSEDTARYGAKLILVRPDHFVAWAGDVVAGNAATILTRVSGHR